MKKSNRSNIDSFIVMDVMEQARLEEEAGRNIVHMEVGQPSTPAPRRAIKDLSDLMHKEPLGYTVALGIPLLRRKISDLYLKWYGIELNPDRVIVTSGSSGAFLLAFTSLFDTGARVGLGAPGYPSYRQILKAMGLEPIILETTSKEKFQVTSNSTFGSELDGLLIASPANPTGSMLNFNSLQSLINKCADNDISFISDEIYPVSYTHLRAHETRGNLVCRLGLEKK